MFDQIRPNQPLIASELLCRQFGLSSFSLPSLSPRRQTHGNANYSISASLIRLLLLIITHLPATNTHTHRPPELNKTERCRFVDISVVVMVGLLKVMEREGKSLPQFDWRLPEPSLSLIDWTINNWFAATMSARAKATFCRNSAAASF